MKYIYFFFEIYLFIYFSVPLFMLLNNWKQTAKNWFLSKNRFLCVSMKKQRQKKTKSVANISVCWTNINCLMQYPVLLDVCTMFSRVEEIFTFLFRFNLLKRMYLNEYYTRINQLHINAVVFQPIYASNDLNCNGDFPRLWLPWRFHIMQ